MFKTFYYELPKLLDLHLKINTFGFWKNIIIPNYFYFLLILQSLYFLTKLLNLTNLGNKNINSTFNIKYWLTLLFLILLTFIFSVNNTIVNLIYLLLIVLVPVTILFHIFNFNLQFLNIIAGAPIKKLIFINIIFDLINLTSFTLRFFIQYIRLLLISLTFFLLIEFFLNVSFMESSQNILNIVISYSRLAFEYLDFFIITFIQFTSFNVLIMWLLNFMFSNNSNNVMEVLCEETWY